jgi:hypothetical protein
MIQKAFRRWYSWKTGKIYERAVVKAKGNKVMNRLRASVLFINNNASHVFENRTNAANVITSFLFSVQKNWKNFALGYLR